MYRRNSTPVKNPNSPLQSRNASSMPLMSSPDVPKRNVGNASPLVPRNSNIVMDENGAIKKMPSRKSMNHAKENEAPGNNQSGMKSSLPKEEFNSSTAKAAAAPVNVAKLTAKVARPTANVARLTVNVAKPTANVAKLTAYVARPAAAVVEPTESATVSLPQVKSAPSSAIIAAINADTTSLNLEAGFNQESGRYNTDEWEITKLANVMATTGGKLVCSLPAGIDKNWVSQHLAEIFTIIGRDFSKLRHEHIAMIKQFYLQKQVPAGISQYFGMPDSFRHNRLHPDIPGHDEHCSYVEYTQISAGIDRQSGKPRPHKSWLWVFKLPAWMGDIEVAVSHAKANVMRPLVDVTGRAIINPETDQPVMEQIGQGGGQQIFVSPVTIALIMAHAFKVIIQDIPRQHFAVLQAQWRGGQLTLVSTNNTSQEYTPFKFFVTPKGEALGQVPSHILEKRLNLNNNILYLNWKAALIKLILSGTAINVENLPTLSVTMMFTIAVLNSEMQLHWGKDVFVTQNEQPNRALIPYVPPSKALMVLA